MLEILDACCGSRMFWFDKKNPNALFMDIREEALELCDGRVIAITPDIVGDFKDMPFDDNTFNLVVFDPPHLIRVGEKSWLKAKYGKLNPQTWKDDLARGFRECFRVLKEKGVLVLKWNEDQVKLSEVLNLTEYQPLFGHRGGKTIFVVFMKLHKTKKL